MVVVKLEVGKFAYPLCYVGTSARDGNYNDDLCGSRSNYETKLFAYDCGEF